MDYETYKSEIKRLLKRWNSYCLLRGYIKDTMCEPLVKIVDYHMETMAIKDSHPELRQHMEEELKSLSEVVGKLIVMQEELH